MSEATDASRPRTKWSTSRSPASMAHLTCWLGGGTKLDDIVAVPPFPPHGLRGSPQLVTEAAEDLGSLYAL